jgi:soluble lytic murein transglycosylase-like protein
MRRALLMLALAAGGLVVARQAGALAAPGGGGSAFADLTEGALGALDDLTYSLTGDRFMAEARWQAAVAKPENAEYVNAARAAEIRHGIPPNLWLRTLWQESRFNPEAFNAGSGATGIAQIVPRWHPGVDATDPFASIDYGAGYLAQLQRQFRSWALALKAYNWGPGNVQKFLAGGPDAPREPEETRNYSAQILADLAAIGQVIA